MAENDPLTVQDPLSPADMGSARLADDASMQDLNAPQTTSNMGARQEADQQSLQDQAKRDRELAKQSLDQKKFYNLYPSLQDADDLAPGTSDMAAVMLNLSYRMGKPLEEIKSNFEEAKAGYAKNKGWDAAISESGMRAKFQEEFKVEDAKQTALNELYGNVVLKAFQDTGMGKNRAMVSLPTEYVKQWEEQHKDLLDGDAGYHAQANRVYNQTLKDIESLRGKGAETFSALMDFTQGKADGDRLAQVAEHLASSTPEERQKVYNYIGLAAEAGHIDRSGLEQFAINMGQSFTRGFDFIPQGTLQGQEDAFREMRDTLATGKVWLRKSEGTPTLNDVYRPSQGAVGSAANIDLTGREATPEEVATLKAQADNGLKTFGVIRELRNVAKSEVDPIRPVFDNSAIERGAYGLAGSLGIMVPVAINPMIGTLAYQAQEYDRIMLENPDINPKFAQGLALFEGAGNAALDRLQLGAINGKLPVFGGLLNGIKSNGIRRVLTTVGAEVLEQNLQEGAQDLIAPLTETMAAALREDMPDKDFGALMKDYLGSRAETFFAVLPLALIGGGVGTYRDLKNPALQLADARLQEAGFGPAQRDYISAAESPEERDARIQQEWGKRKEQDITAGKELIAARIAEVSQQKGGDTVEVSTKADGTSEWIVRDPAGKEVARVASEAEAATIIADRGEAEIKSQANVVADLLDSDWRKDKLPNFEAIFGGEVTPEQLLKDAEAKGDTKLVESIKASIEAHGNDPAQLAKLRVLGESWVTPYAEGQYKAFVKLNEGHTAQDAFEELAHNIFDIDIAEGRITKEQAREWVSQAAAAGVANYKFGTDAEVRESMAQIAQDFARNKLDQTNLPSSFVAFLKKLYTEFVEFMRRAKLLDQAFKDGKIDAEFERYLMGKIGLSDATMIEREVSRIEGEEGGSQQLDLFQESRATPEAGADVRTVGDTKIVGPTSFAIRAYHGTPHEVDKFSTEKIGTGEGAAAFGYGLYFAQNQQVARIYQEQLRPLTEVRNLTVGGIEIYKDGSPVDYSPYQYTRTPKPEDYARASLQEDLLINEHELRSAFDSKGIQGAKEAMEAVIKDRLEMAREEDPEKAPFYETALKRLQDDHNTHVDFEKGKSNLYRVEIDAEEDHLLLWDKSINDQPDAVKEIVRGILKEKGYLRANDNGPRVLKSAFDAYKMAEGAAFRDGDGSGIYEMIASNLIEKSGSARGSDYAAEKMASDLLDKNGIRGIKYLDAGSRGTSKRTHNFVIFDGKHIQITEKNGQPVSVEDVPVDGDKSFSIRARDEAYDPTKENGGVDAFKEKLKTAVASLPEPSEENYDFHLEKGSIFNLVDDYFREAFNQLGAKFDEHRASTGSTYIHISIPQNEGDTLENTLESDRDNHKITVRDHDVSVFRAREFGSPTKTIQVDNFDTKENILKAATRLSEHLTKILEPYREYLAEKANPDAISDTGAAGIKTDALLGEADKSSIPALREGKGSALTDDTFEQSFPDVNPQNNDIRYSIQSQEQIDRVNKAVADTTQFAEGRMALYERAKERFKAVLAENKDILDAADFSKASRESRDYWNAFNQLEELNAREQKEIARAKKKDLGKAEAQVIKEIAGKFKAQRKALEEQIETQQRLLNEKSSNKIRRQKLIQAIAELEVILRQLPAEVRGKVGGFGVLARGGTGDTFLANFFRDRVRMIDEQLEKYLSKEYDEELSRVFDRAKPKKDKPGEKPKGIGADIQDLFAKVKEAQRWSAEEINAHLAAIDSRLESDDLSPADEARLTREADLIGLVGGWKNKTSNEKAHAIATLKETWAKGYYNFILKKTQEKEQRISDRKEAIAATGKEGVLSERQEADKKENGLGGKFKKGYFNLISWDQFVSVLFGEKSEIATRLSNGERLANAQKEDATQAKMDEISDFFAKLAKGDKLKGEQLRWQMSQKSLKPFAGTPWSNLEFSEMEALSATMLWMQEDGKRHMLGKFDDGGKPISNWHYTQEFVDLLENNLSKEAKAFRDFLLKKYDTEYDSINKVYKALNGINLPKIENYSPVTVAPINAPAGTAIDPVTGGVMAARGTSPGALRSRGQAIAEPKFSDVLQTYIAHTKQMEHWKAYAPFMQEANGILRNRDVQNAIEAKGGKEAKAVLNTWTDLFSQGGVRSAEAQLGLSKDISALGGRAARVALVGRLGTIIIQSTQLGAALAEMPTGAYILRMSKLLSGNLGWKAAFESDYIQRRLNEMPPIVRQAVEGLKSDRPNVVKSAVEKLGRLISGADAIFTAGTYAITYDYHLKQAKDMGIPSPEAYAKSVAERAVDRLAQPTRMGARSVIENTSTGLIRNFWAFASESRKNLGLAAYAMASKDPARIGRTLVSLVILNSLVGNIIRNAWSDAKDDDDDEWFDEKHWGLKRMIASTMVDSIQVRGIPVLGDAISEGFYDAFNQYHQSGYLVSFASGIRAMKHIPKYVEGDADWEMTFKDIDGILSVGGLFNENIAAAASLSHLATDAFGLTKNTKKAVTED